MRPRHRVSWREPYGPRQFGTFIKWTPDGLAMVRRGATVHYLDQSEMTWEEVRK